MNNAKNKQTHRLSAFNLEQIMNIRINMPDQRTFDAMHYAQVWIDQGHMRSDDPAQLRDYDREGARPKKRTRIENVPERDY